MMHRIPSRSIRHCLRGLLSVLAVAVASTVASAEEPKSRTYTLSAAPLEIYDRLSELKMGPAPRLSDDERRLLAKVWEQKAKNPAAALEPAESRLPDAMLFASGIEDAAARRKYCEQLDTLAVKARDAVKDAKNVPERGERLMKFLHESVLKQGYEAEQTSFAKVFDTGKFNCVSSTATYYILGSRLGLELRPVSIPGSWPQVGHASLDMIANGKRIQVEPTNPDGFDWGSKVNRAGVVVLSFVPDRKDGHEVDGPGIAAMIYSNRGVALAKQNPPQRLEAARCYLAALALDPLDESAANNLLAVFVNWGPELTAAKKHEDALRVLAFGLSLAPKTDALHTNHCNAWSHYIDDTLQAGNDAEALALICRAAKVEREKSDFQSAAHWFIRRGEQLIKKDNSHEAGLASVERGLKLLERDEVTKLREWRSGVFRRWSQARLEKNDPDGSLKVLAQAHALDSSDQKIIDGIAFHAQEALEMLENKGMPAMLDHFKALRATFPKLDVVADAGASHAARRVHKLAEDKKFKEAVAAVEKYQPLFTKPAQHADVGGSAYDLWARDLAGADEPEAALGKYAEGLKAFPKHDRLTGNAVATVDKWAGPAISEKKWEEAIRIYSVGLRYLPGNRHLQDNKEFCEKRRGKSK